MNIGVVGENSPILLFTKYSYEIWNGNQVAVCLTQASNSWTITYFVMTITIFFLLPLIILIIIYSIIAKSLISKKNKIVKICPNKSEINFKARKQVVVMLGAVVLSFFMCLLPFRILTLWIIIVPDENFLTLTIEKYYNILYFCRIMLYLNSAINPILYNLMSTKFRRGFLKICYCFHLFKFNSKNSLTNNNNNHLKQFNTNTTTTTTTTTTSIILNNSLKKYNGRNSGNEHKTVSLDDLRTKRNEFDFNDREFNKWFEINLLRQSSTPLLIETNNKDFKKCLT